MSSKFQMAGYKVSTRFVSSLKTLAKLTTKIEVAIIKNRDQKYIFKFFLIKTTKILFESQSILKLLDKSFPDSI